MVAEEGVAELLVEETGGSRPRHRADRSGSAVDDVLIALCKGLAGEAAAVSELRPCRAEADTDERCPGGVVVEVSGGVGEEFPGAEVGHGFGGRVDRLPLVRLAGERRVAGGCEKRHRAAVVVPSQLLWFEGELA